MSARYGVDLCRGFTKIGEATAFAFDAVIRNLATGEWRLTAPIAAGSTDGLEVADPMAVDSIVVRDLTDPDRIVFGGLVRPITGFTSGIARRVVATGTEVTYIGVDIFGLLGLRQAWPTPSAEPPWADSYDVRTGRGSEVAAGFIEANIGASAITARQISDLTVIDAGAGTSSTWSGRLQPLDQFVARICRESGVSCRATYVDGGGFRFTLVDPTDRSTSIVVSDQGDLEELSQIVVPATASYVVAAGQGELNARSFAVADDGEDGIDRVEIVYENTNISTSAGLQTAADTELVLNGADVAVDGLISEEAAQRIEYLTDYDLGDWLGVEVDGERYRSQVEAVRIELSPSRETIRPILGRAATNELRSLVKHVDDLTNRFDRQVA